MYTYMHEIISGENTAVHIVTVIDTVAHTSVHCFPPGCNLCTSKDKRMYSFYSFECIQWLVLMVHTV